MTDLSSSLFVRACRAEPVDRTPIWVMRQAGRYLPEYQEVRKNTSFLGLCKTPELAAEVTFQPIRRFALDAAIIFSDILVPVEAMGVPLDYQPGPVLGTTVQSQADVDRLTVPDPISKMGFVMDAIKTFRAGMPEVPLIGFVGAPFTLAAYAIEGGGSKTYDKTKSLMYREPRTFRNLLGKLTETVAQHLIAQVEAGANAVQIFDSWAGYLSRDDYLNCALPFTIDIVERVKKTGVPVIVFAKGVHSCLPELSQIGADVLGVDWTTPLDVAGRLTENRVVLQGNLDPCVLLGPKERIEREVQRVFNEALDLKGHVFNLGHGILKMTPPENMGALVDAVKRIGVKRFHSVTRTIAIVGGGISGLSAAEAIERKSADAGSPVKTVVLEAASSAGGKIKSQTEQGFVMETGPHGFLDKEPKAFELIERLGLTDALVTADEAAERRFVMRGGRLREVPSSPPKFLMSDILPAGAKARLLMEPVAKGRPEGEESVWDFAARRIGKTAADVLVDAMVTGIYGGDPKKLSLISAFPRMYELESEYGGLFKAQMALAKQKKGSKAGAPTGTMHSFGAGLGLLTDALADRVEVRTGAAVEKIDRAEGGFTVHHASGSLSADGVVLTVPAFVAEDLVGPHFTAAGILGTVNYADVAVVVQCFRREDIEGDLRGFGFLVPECEQRPILGTIIASSVFPAHAPEGAVMLRTIVGGVRHPEHASADDATLLQVTRGQLEEILSISRSAEPIIEKVLRWPRGIPQYELGHQTKVAVADDVELAVPGMFIAGNAFRGVAMLNCIAEGDRVADRVLKHLL